MTNPDSSQDALVIDRTFDATIGHIWQLWTVPEHFQAWYGPTGVSIPVAKMDVRVGGTRLICMEMPTPNGLMQMWFTGEYLEVVENQRLVYTESISDEDGKPATPAGVDTPTEHQVTEVRVELEDVDGRTRMVMTHVGIPADSSGATGWTMALDKLAAYIESNDG